MLSILSHVGRGTALFEQVSASSGMLHGMLVKRVNKKTFTTLMSCMTSVKILLHFHCLSLLVTKVPDLARAPLSLGLFMSQDEAKLQPVKEGHTHGYIMDT